MKQKDAVETLGALAQESRLDVFRMLALAGPDGFSAGQVATSLDIAPNALTFHFDRLRSAGLVTVRREGRSMIYAAHFEPLSELLDYLIKNFCESLTKSSLAAKGRTQRTSK